MIAQISRPPASAPSLRAAYDLLRHQILTGDEERAVALAYQRSGDPTLMQRLVLANMRFIAMLAYRCDPVPGSLPDLLAEGVVGLIGALRSYDASLGFRLQSYYCTGVRGCLGAFVGASLSVVRRQRGHRSRRCVVPDVSLDQVVTESVISMLPGYDNLSQRRFDHGVLAMDYLVDLAPGPETLVSEREEQEVLRSVVRSVLATLPQREQAVLHARYLSDERATCLEIAARLGVTGERVRQLEQEALRKMRRKLRRLRAMMRP